jgi:O-antigen ligase
VEALAIPAAPPTVWARVRGLLPLGAALSLAVAYPLFADGGFSNSSRALFVALAGFALMCASQTAAGPGAGGISVAARSPVVLSLVALGVLSCLSGLWTIMLPSAAIRWGLVILGYAAVVVAARQLATRTGPWPFAIGLLVLAVAEALLGLQGVARHALPYAENLYGRWRPGGSFEYQPALALLEVSALPVLVGLVSLRVPLARAAKSRVQPRPGQSSVPGRAGRAIRTAGAVFAALWAVPLGCSIALSGSRLEPTLGALLMLTLICRPPRSFTRPAAIAVAVLLLAGAGLAVPTKPAAPTRGHSLTRTVDRRGAAHHHSGGSHPTASQPKQTSNFLHGRAHEWLAAIETWEDRPLIGAGTGSYFAASVEHQGAYISLFAHDLPLEEAAELGIVGFLIAIALYAGTIRALFQAAAPASRLTLVLLGPMCGFFLISNLVDWTWHLAGLGAIWAAATGAVLAASSSGDPPPSARSAPQQPQRH